MTPRRIENWLRARGWVTTARRDQWGHPHHEIVGLTWEQAVAYQTTLPERKDESLGVALADDCR